MYLRLLDLDGSLVAQAGLARHPAVREILDLRALSSELRLWGSEAGMQRFAAALPPLPPVSAGPEVTFFGSGDFHHLAVPLLARVTEPVSLVHFDNHPDWVQRPPRWHCGSWVNRALELPQLRQVLTVGPCSSDLDWPQFKGANLAAVAAERIVLMPWRQTVSRRLGRPDLAWTCLGGRSDWLAELDRRLTALPTEAVWVSIDKDVLAPADAVTNWDQGEMPLSALEAALAQVGRRRRVLGIDICGEFSPPVFRGWHKRLASWLDRQSGPALDPGIIPGRNEATNLRLLAVFESLAA